MGQFSVEKPVAPGSVLSGNQQKRINKGKPLAPILLIRGDMTRGLPLIVADGYHRICAICYFDESAPIPCRTAALGR